jgi:predicted phage tail protein
MKKMTQADRDAGLTQEDVDAGLRGGQNERISSDDRLRAKMNAEKYNSPSIVDMYRDYSKNPEAKSFPVADREKIKEVPEFIGARKGGMVKMKKGGKVSSASSRADGCAVKGKTKGRIV